MFRVALARSRVISRSSITAGPNPVGATAATKNISAILCFNRFNSQKAGDFWTAPVLTYEQVKPRTEQPTPSAYLIDVREPDEVILGSIPSSVNLPLNTLRESLHLNPVAFKEKFGFEKPKADQEIVFYCRSGKRSASASDIAQKNGFTNVFNYEGSWLDWTSREQGKSS